MSEIYVKINWLDSASKVTNKAEKKKRSPKKKKKDPNAPGSVISAYTFFFRDKQATIKEQNPKAKFGDISKIVSQLWEALGETERAVYRQKNAEDKIRYGKELEAYKAGRKSQNYFLRHLFEKIPWEIR